MCVKMYGGGEATCVDISYGDQLDCGGVLCRHGRPDQEILREARA